MGWKGGGGCVGWFVWLVEGVEVVAVGEEFGVRAAAFYISVGLQLGSSLSIFPIALEGSLGMDRVLGGCNDAIDMIPGTHTKRLDWSLN